MTYRENPDWQEAQRRLIGDDNTDASPDEVLAEGIKAAFDMYVIETLDSRQRSPRAAAA
jgi:hypothetical protein